MQSLVISFQCFSLLVILIGVPNVKDIHVELPLDVIEPLAVVLPGHLKEHVILVHLHNIIKTITQFLSIQTFRW